MKDKYCKLPYRSTQFIGCYQDHTLDKSASSEIYVSHFRIAEDVHHDTYSRWLA